MMFLRIIFCFWLLLANTLLLADVISYYKIMFNVDWFQLINREMNVIFAHWFIVLPFNIVTFYLIKPKNITR